MGTHPIFESDFDCLTECRKVEIRNVNHQLSSSLLARCFHGFRWRSAVFATVSADPRDEIYRFILKACLSGPAHCQLTQNFLPSWRNLRNCSFSSSCSDDLRYVRSRGARCKSQPQ